jgi:catechol 2,3-dioxygenase-like lactoylglutathione lyase family enzyme
MRMIGKQMTESSAQPGSRDGSACVDGLYLSVKDPSKSVRFCADVLGFSEIAEIYDQPPEIIVGSFHICFIAYKEMPRPRPRRGSFGWPIEVCVEIDDVAAWHDRFVARGVSMDTSQPREGVMLDRTRVLSTRAYDLDGFKVLFSQRFAD